MMTYCLKYVKSCKYLSCCVGHIIIICASKAKDYSVHFNDYACHLTQNNFAVEHLCKKTWLTMPINDEKEKN